MSKLLASVLKTAPIVLGASLLMAGNAKADTLSPVDINAVEDPMGQVTSVDQLRDVSPSDWAYPALQQLVENYNCIAGYPNGTFRGNKPLSRYEFAAGLNACLNAIERRLGGGEEVNPNDLATLRRLVQEFEGELKALGARVDDLESRVGFLEDHQFSTTTKLVGEVIYNIGGVFGDEQADGKVGKGKDLLDNITLNDRVRLNFNTSFTGKDLLRVRLQAGNFNDSTNTEYNRTASNTNMARLAYGDGSENNVVLDDVFYRFPAGDKATLWVGTNALNFDDIFSTTNPYFADSGKGAISRFARYNPLAYRGNSGAGAGLRYKFNDKFAFTGSYLTNNGLSGASDPGATNGLFNGAYTATAQLGFMPTKNFEATFTYAHSYAPGNDVSLTGGTGSSFANQPFGKVATSSDNYNLGLNWKASSTFNINGWVGLADADQVGTSNSATILNWAVGLAFPDLGKKGNLGGIIFGMPPKATDNDVVAKEDKNTSYHIEALYRYQVNDNIAITPGFFILLNPEHNDNNDTIYIGTVRTTFSF